MLSQSEHSEEDKQRDCVHYPTKDFQTYADCDQDYVRKILPSDLVPFWNADNITQASSFWENEEIRQRALANIGFYRYNFTLKNIHVQRCFCLVKSCLSAR